MISLGNNTFKHPHSVIDEGIDYNIFHSIRDNDEPLSKHFTYHQFITTTCDVYNKLIQEEHTYIYSTFNDERFILIAIAGMLSGKTVLTIDDSLKGKIYINTLNVIENENYKETLKDIEKRIVNGDTGGILFNTSGSTGTVKSVYLSWHNIMAAIHTFCNDDSIDKTELDSILHCLPHTHIYGFLMELLSISFGLYMQYTSPSELYKRYLEIKPSVLPIVPAILNKLYEKRVPLSVKLLISAGAPLRLDVAEFYGKTCRQILKGYGTTESTACLTLSIDPKDDGVCALCNIVHIANDGELLVKGLSVSDIFIGPDGWYHTNDIVSLESNNRLRIVGRKNNTIKLQQGEFINLDELSILYTTNSMDTVVYANPLDRYPRAIVYIDNTINPDDIQDIFKDIHERNNRKGYERIQNITVRSIKDMPLINGVKPNYKHIREEAMALHV